MVVCVGQAATIYFYFLFCVCIMLSVSDLLSLLLEKLVLVVVVLVIVVLVLMRLVLRIKVVKCWRCKSVCCASPGVRGAGGGRGDALQCFITVVAHAIKQHNYIDFILRKIAKKT